MKTIFALLLYAAIAFGAVWFSTWLMYTTDSHNTQYGPPPTRFRVGVAVFMFFFMVALDLIQGVGVGQ